MAAETIHYGPCRCGGYGQVLDAETQRGTGRCHDEPESARRPLADFRDPLDTITIEAAADAIARLSAELDALRRAAADLCNSTHLSTDGALAVGTDEFNALSSMARTTTAEQPEHGPWCGQIDEDHTLILRWLAGKLEPHGKELSDFGQTVDALDFLCAGTDERSSHLPHKR